MSNIPVIFIQYGSHRYTKDMLTLAKKNNERVILITTSDEVDVFKEVVEVYAIESYFNMTSFFKTIYVHMSSNTDAVEFFNFQRILVLYEFMKDKDIENVFFCDNSILLNVDVNDLGLDMQKTYYCIPDNTKKPYRWSASIHCAMLNLDFMECFVSFVFEHYQDDDKLKILKDKYDFHQETNNSGGICDMTLLYLYSKDNEIENLLDIGFDHTITSDESSTANYYKLVSGMKDITVKDGKFYAKTFRDDFQILHSLNFQGQVLKDFDYYYNKLI